MAGTQLKTSVRQQTLVGTKNGSQSPNLNEISGARCRRALS